MKKSTFDKIYRKKMQLPEPFVLRMQQLLGTEYPDFVNALSQNSNVSVRINPIKHPGELAREKVDYCQTGYFLPVRPIFTLDPLFHSGVYYVQEASSMFLEQAVKAATPDKNAKILDLCAAPGGKSTHLATLLNGNGLLVSNEVIRSRAQILSENLKKWGVKNVIVTNNDPSDFQRLTGFFDCIVIDAPCSGEGLFRRDEEAISEWSIDNAALCAQRQRRIVADTWPALKENGLLIYSTCTYNQAENEENIKWLSEFAEIEAIEIPLHHNWGIVQTNANGIPGYRFYPHKTLGEGFFTAVVRKKQREKEAFSKKTKDNQLIVSKVQREQAQKLLADNDCELLTINDTIIAFPRPYMADLLRIKESFRIVHAGIKIGEFKQKELIPAHELALSEIINPDYFSAIELPIEQALRYLKRDEFVARSSEKGWNLVKYQQIPLGWAKNLGNRFNNGYPKEWRIRMDIAAYQGERLADEIQKFPIDTPAV